MTFSSHLRTEGLSALEARSLTTYFNIGGHCWSQQLDCTNHGSGRSSRSQTASKRKLVSDFLRCDWVQLVQHLGNNMQEHYVDDNNRQIPRSPQIQPTHSASIWWNFYLPDPKNRISCFLRIRHQLVQTVTWPCTVDTMDISAPPWFCHYSLI